MENVKLQQRLPPRGGAPATRKALHNTRVDGGAAAYSPAIPYGIAERVLQANSFTTRRPKGPPAFTTRKALHTTRVDGGTAAYSPAIPYGIAERILQAKFFHHAASRRATAFTTRKALHCCAGLFLWWERVDSDHRRHCQQIYSLSPLATRERSLIKIGCYRRRMPPPNITGAGERSRTINLLITNQLLCH